MADKECAQKIKILLVEDHQLTRIGIKTVLGRTEDLTVVAEAANGEEAVAAYQSAKPDVVLMDVGMPIMDGIQASKTILESNSAAKIIMLTSHDNEQDIAASLAAGAGGYCLKDVEPDRLYAAIRSVFAGDIWLDAAIAAKVLKQQTSRAKTQESQWEFTKNEAPSTAVEPRPAPGPSLPEPLSPRELEVLNLIVEGLSNQDIADRLIISLPTAKTHVRNILNKLAVDDRTQAAVQAMRRGLV
ncbi:MAG: response regulator transcription factor [Candidatus Obscuribacterales bacterium]|nr:response regulator transcription factor [Candidatus Obscuribacterales bacterium]